MPHYKDNAVPMNPLAFPGPAIFPALLGEAGQALLICTSQQEYALPRVSMYNFRILLEDGWQTVPITWKQCTKVRATATRWWEQSWPTRCPAALLTVPLAHQCYFHTSADNYCLLAELAPVSRAYRTWQTIMAGRPRGQADARLSLVDCLCYQCGFIMYHDLATPIMGPNGLPSASQFAVWSVTLKIDRMTLPATKNATACSVA